MRIDLSAATLRLARGQTIAIERGRCVAIELLAGHVWLTEDGTAGDSLPRPGERVVLAGRGKAVIEALRDAEIRLLVPRARSHADLLRALLGAVGSCARAGLPWAGAGRAAAWRAA
jgi:hypothetical protein